ncbi:MAG: molybdopterin-guanine dinucleotide biosynthesis protein B [Flexistipes sinusarabici]|uniref:Molybdopterin-guanine dinucleotide biosynthesis protein B n=1 Tax=Flexistipes sinusarabici TaxID=2352 RepID=A0A5D0MUQ5_FLESI|nr:molybdopterin-guanine dinucleotide biosynthesis protein B [Flexistipes sinusarabici]TYB35813.1 MAG: molybdopterin-guanine dinucleotide biosynthesis protein B [Flexistipes sinusarabici]
MKKHIPVVSFVGSSGSGKTTFLEQIIPVFIDKGYKIGAIKHDAHKFEIDKPGKDSYRLKQAGAEVVCISSAEKLALIQSCGNEYTVEELILKFFGNVDLILTEGYKKSDLPKFEIFRSANNKPPLNFTNKELIGVISDDKPEVDVQVFSFAEKDKVVSYILTLVGESRPEVVITGVEEKYQGPLKEYLTALATLTNVNKIKIKIDSE